MVGRSYSDASSSGECEDEVLAHKAHWATETELRELREETRGSRDKEGNRRCSSRKLVNKAGLKKMEVDEEVDSKNKLDQRKKELQKQLRDIEKFTGMPQDTQDVLREKWQQEIQDIEQRPNGLLTELQNMQKRPEKLHSLQDNKKQCQNHLGKWAGDRERVRNQIEEKHAQLQELGQRIQKTSLAEVELDDEIRNLQAGEEIRGSCASQSNGCSFDPAVVQELYITMATQAWQQLSSKDKSAGYLARSNSK